MGQLQPRVGDVYYARASVLSYPDPRGGHPVVVIQDAPVVQRVMVAGRTSQTGRFAGFEHAADEALGLDRDGVFPMRFFQSIEYPYFTDDNFTYKGALPEPTLAGLLEFFEVTP